jgi:glycosyltransferase involved in cell wall biosynthesis
VKIFLVGNYHNDRIESMDRFAAALEGEMQARRINVRILRPPVIFGRLCRASLGFGKWLGYIDKYLVFIPLLMATVHLSKKADPNILVHICDHSNAIYTIFLRRLPHLVTCHDLLAIRCAHGEFSQNFTSSTGRLYQKLILHGLRSARRIACVSQSTMNDLLRFAGRRNSGDLLIPVGLNFPYSPMDPRQYKNILIRLDSRLSERLFILHVGSNDWYKNRQGVAAIFAALRASSSLTPLLVFVGQKPTGVVLDYLQQRGLADDIITLGHCTNLELQALYSGAAALLFPSLAEGFGWPLIEAQACGCPTVTTDREPMSEVGGPTSVKIDSQDVSGAAQQLEQLLNEGPEARGQRVAQGLKHAAQFTCTRMTDEYLAAYRTLIEEGSA